MRERRVTEMCLTKRGKSSSHRATKRGRQPLTFAAGPWARTPGFALRREAAVPILATALFVRGLHFVLPAISAT